LRLAGIVTVALVLVLVTSTDRDPMAAAARLIDVDSMCRVLLSRRGTNCRAQCAKVGVPRGVGTTGPPYYQRMRGSKILITGPTGQLATPIALALAADNEVWGVARFTNPAAREGLEIAGIRCQTVNLAAEDFTGLPSDFDYVLNLAVAKSGDWDTDLGANAESVGLLMAHCRGAKAFLHCSSAAVYDPPDDEPRTERSALGDNHKCLFPTYSISKVAGEVVARSMARILDVPTVIARLNVPYGNNGGWPYYHMEMMLAGIPIPVPPGGPARYNPIHEDDIIATLPKLLDAASVPATTVNWCGDQAVSLQEWCGYLGSLVGKEPVFEASEQALRGNPTDVTRMHELIGGTTVDWQDGLRRMAAKFHPELVGT
jgi:nucleoside-diphosphate-sugar epimerase